MNMQLRSLLVGSLFTAAATASSAAGLVNVSFVDSARYTDAGISSSDKDANIKGLQSYLQELGSRHLATGDVLKIEVLDIDLAGTVKPWPRTGSEIRVVKGGADWPRISVRYTLEVDGKTVRSATEQVADMNYTRGLVSVRGPQPLQYEKNMLEKWFKARFIARGAAGDS